MKKLPAKSTGKRAASTEPKRPRLKNLRWIGIAAGIVAIFATLYGYYYIDRQRTLAEFDGGKITREEFLKAFRLEAGKYDPLVWKDEKRALEIKGKMLDELVEEKILLDMAKKSGISVSDSELATELESYKSSYTETTFRQMLGISGINYDDWAEKKKNKYTVQKLIEQEVIGKMPVDPADVKKYYQEHAGEFTHPAEVRARHILVSSWDEASKLAKELEAGGNFAAIAKKQSISPERWNGGDLGYFSAGTHPEVFDRVCFGTPVGGTSPIVKSEYGYHIFRIIDRREPVKESLEEATPYITDRLKQEKSADAFKNWFKPIMDSASVKKNEEHLKNIEVTINEEATN